MKELKSIEIKNINNVLKEMGIKTKWLGIIPKSTIRVLNEMAKKWGSFDNDKQEELSKQFMIPIERR